MISEEVFGICSPVFELLKVCVKREKVTVVLTGTLVCIQISFFCHKLKYDSYRHQRKLLLPSAKDLG